MTSNLEYRGFTFMLQVGKTLKNRVYRMHNGSHHILSDACAQKSANKSSAAVRRPAAEAWSASRSPYS